MEDGWQAELVNQQVGGVSDTVTVTPERLAEGDVTVTIAVGSSAAEPVWFSDGLYGATAWAWEGDGWRRADAADMRTMMAPSLSPGERATVTLPLASSPTKVRVLIRTPDGLGAWADVS
jgi:hypothetical protein